MNTVPSPSHIALFMSALAGGGVQRSMRNLAVALAQAGHRVDLIVCHDNNAPTPDLDRAGVRCISLQPASALAGRLLALRADPSAWRVLARPVLLPLKSANKLRYLPALRDYLARERPIGLISAMTQCNLVALWARCLARVPTRVAVSERNMFSQFVRQHRRAWRWRHMPALAAHSYRSADAIIAVSDAVARDLVTATSLSPARIAVAPNPVVDRELEAGRAQPLAHPWFVEGAPPVVLGVGRLVEQKDPATLIHAFARLRAQRPARLVLLGDGPQRARLTGLAKELGVADDVEFAGWVDNPFVYMAHAAVMALPSRWEGLPGVLIQAMACGCPVVATDCPGGSAEILENGRYGRLVPVGDAAALASAIGAEIETPTAQSLLRERAAFYTPERAAERYMSLLMHGS